MISIIHTTHDRLPEKLQNAVISQLERVKPANAELIIVSETAIDRGDKNVVLEKAKPSLETLYDCVLEGIKASRGDCIYPHAESDCLYPEGYFLNLRGGINYNMNMWRMNTEGAFPDYRWPSFSGCVGDRDSILRAVENKLWHIQAGRKIKWCEPEFESKNYGTIWHDRPYVDIRWGGNLTGDRKGEYQQEIPGWGRVDYLQEMVGLK
jgi:hypothetical protein